MCNYENLINEQIKRELEASNFYFALHFKFLSQSNHRPNFAKLLKERTEEEKEHASVLAKFQVERGAAVKVNRLNRPQQFPQELILMIN